METSEYMEMENEAINIGQDSDNKQPNTRLALTLVSKLWTTEHFNTNTFKNKILNLWKIKNGGEIMELASPHKPTCITKAGLHCHMANVVNTSTSIWTKSLKEKARVEVERSTPTSIVARETERKPKVEMFWKEQTSFFLISQSSNHIYGKISDLLEETWCITSLYGYSEESQRIHRWELMERINEQIGPKLLCMGDINTITCNLKKQGGHAQNVTQLMAFRDYLDVCGLEGLMYEGYEFTWDNDRVGEKNIKERLDRGVRIASFREAFPQKKSSTSKNMA
ncbi:hypothetical protein VNO77_19003 [Canavalia gladiata]|uniref:Uncharacterized protein n=1 Tax=Canavalia gladiata TaxID=3824 RepID=A0AAN9LMK6_CANGL